MNKLKKAIFNNCIKTDRGNGDRIIVTRKDDLTYFITLYYGFILKNKDVPFDIKNEKYFEESGNNCISVFELGDSKKLENTKEILIKENIKLCKFKKDESLVFVNEKFINLFNPNCEFFQAEDKLGAIKVVLKENVVGVVLPCRVKEVK